MKKAKLPVKQSPAPYLKNQISFNYLNNSFYYEKTVLTVESMASLTDGALICTRTAS